MDDIVLIDKTRNRVNFMLGCGDILWRPKVSGVEVRLDTQNISKRDRFKHIRFIIHKSRDINDDITHCIGATWMKWMLASNFCVIKRVVIRVTLLYEIECWPVQKLHIQKGHVVEMRMLRWMCGHTRSDMITNKDIQNKVGVASALRPPQSTR
ncbi:hypothetical protein H5410_036941 [Solanum commersonii]|uniref:Uncharacterized protein n=1 Tax=Solanum commersonii TaxID=4109 RepID=A0A9J5Y6C0_SOLCO|nr:hypothetical protein H5410_036941 [Solanum commersonii]